MWTQTVFKLLALSVMGGIFCGALWDVFKIPQVLFKDKAKKILHTAVVFISDVTFCLLCGCMAILVFYYGNEGNIRGVAVVLMAVGFWAYRVSLGAFTCFFAKKLCLFFRKVRCALVCKIKNVNLKIRKQKIKEE